LKKPVESTWTDVWFLVESTVVVSTAKMNWQTLVVPTAVDRMVESTAKQLQLNQLGNQLFWSTYCFG